MNRKQTLWLIVFLIVLTMFAIAEVISWDRTLDSLPTGATLTAAWNEQMMESVRMTAIAP